MTPATVATPAELAHRKRLRDRDFRARDVRELRASHVGASGMTPGELADWSARLKREALARHPEWRLA